MSNNSEEVLENDSAGFDLDWDVDVYDHKPQPKQIKKQEESEKKVNTESLNEPRNIFDQKKDNETQDHSKIVSPKSEHNNKQVKSNEKSDILYIDKKESIDDHKTNAKKNVNLNVKIPNNEKKVDEFDFDAPDIYAGKQESISQQKEGVRKNLSSNVNIPENEKNVEVPDIYVGKQESMDYHYKDVRKNSNSNLENKEAIAQGFDFEVPKYNKPPQKLSKENSGKKKVVKFAQDHEVLHEGIYSDVSVSESVSDNAMQRYMRGSSAYDPGLVPKLKDYQKEMEKNKKNSCKCNIY